MTDNSLSERVVRALEDVDLRSDPRRHADGALLLAEVQEYEQEGVRLRRRVEAFESGGAGPRAQRGSLADRAYEVLLDSEGPMRYREIAAEIRGRGFEHARTPKNAEQLADSVWTAMYEDKNRFVKVGRGIWDLVERQER